jgi:isoleucyl-tRNA synthetase
MTDAPNTPRDYRDTVFLPKTDFPMKAGLPQKEPGILARWNEQGLYHKLREARAGREKFILHDGPPYANGDMHIGHALNHILKDMVCRTQSLLGKDAPYVPGWDCHGLPIEWKVEEQYRKKKLNKDEVPVKEFRAECRAYAQKWVDVQREQVKRLGVLGHWDKPYLTMDFDSEATIVAELMKFAESGQLYRGAKPVMWSPVEKTALAEAEVEYEDITSTQIDVAFEITHCPNVPELVGAYAVIWTTTPWTIPVNQAIAYGAEVEYGLFRMSKGKPIWVDDLQPGQSTITSFERNIVVANDKLLLIEIRQRLKANGYSIEFIKAFKGSELAGTMARHPMAKHLRRPVLDTGLGSSSEAAENSQAPHQVRGDDWERMVEFFERPRPFLDGSSFVTTETGTGLVHMAPDHGEDDFDLCKAHGLEPQFAVEGDGKYRADWAWLGGQGSVINPKFNAPDGPICSDLREAGGLLAASADYKHSYPHSWRSKAKVIYRCTPQWFVPMDKVLVGAPSVGFAATSPGRGGSALENPPLPGEGDHPRPWPQDGGGVSTLRQTALTAIAATRFVPEKGRNRIGSMVEGRPDWVLSRQRAWGVPITLFVDRKTGQYLCDPAVNARIVAAVKEQGVDAWEDARAQEYLGDAYRAEDYERVVDILDVWFDSGCTHVFTLESGKWPELLREPGYDGPPADLYLEGSDQHRGWFQSSLLESCGTRGRAPYKAVLTHGFTMDAKGRKMSKSEGNTVDPLKVMETNGADIIRLWALSVDFTEDHRIGDEILKGVADQYRKLRNTFRYLLGALEGFSDAEKVAVAEMPELERYVLHLLADMDAKLKQAVDDFDFNSYVRLLTDFCNEDLSAFYFDIRKDSLYCDAPTSVKRRAYRTVLDTLFHALVRYAAPVLVFTAEEVWGTRFPDAGSVHLLEWPEVPFSRHPGPRAGVQLSEGAEGSWTPDQVRGDELVAKWASIRALRDQLNERIEPLRREKLIGSSLEANVAIVSYTDETATFLRSTDFAEIGIVSRFKLVEGEVGSFSLEALAQSHSNHPVEFEIEKTTHRKCGRCWRHLPEVTEDGTLCARCEDVVNG